MDEKERARALEATLGQIEKQFGKGLDSSAGREGRHRSGFGDFDGIDFARCGARHRRLSARPHLRNLRTGIVG